MYINQKIKQMHIVEITKLRESSNFIIVVSDGKENKRNTSELHNEFRKQAEEFIQEKYGEHLNIHHSEIIPVEWVGSLWIELIPKTSGIIEMISEEYGLSIQNH